MSTRIERAQDRLVPLVSALGALLLFFFVTALPMIPAVAAGEAGKPYMPLAMLAGYGLAGFVLVQLARGRFEASVLAGPVPWASAPWMALATVGASCAGLALGALVYLHIPGCGQRPEGLPLSWARVALPLVAAPLVEEVLFRGVMLRMLLPAFRPTTAIVITSMLFAMAHVYPMKMPHTLLGGLLLGWCFLKTRSIWLSVWGHFVNNASAMVIDLPQDVSAWPITAMLVLGTMAAVLGWWGLRGTIEAPGQWIRRRTKRTRPAYWSTAS